jgi:hypothetical protein
MACPEVTGGMSEIASELGAAEAAGEVRLFAASGSGGIEELTAELAETARKREKMQRIIETPHAGVNWVEPPSVEGIKTGGQRHAEWVNSEIAGAIQRRLGPEIDLMVDKLVEKLKVNGKLGELESVRFHVAKTEKNGVLFDVLDREGYMFHEGEGDQVDHYLGPAGYIAANLLGSPDVDRSDKYFLVGGNRRVAGAVINSKIQTAITHARFAK